MFGQFAESTLGTLRETGRRFRVILPKSLVGATYHAARAIQTEDDITQEYSAKELAAIAIETLPPEGAS